MRRSTTLLVPFVLALLLLLGSCEPSEEGSSSGSVTPATPTGVPSVCLYEGALFVQGDVDAETGVLTESSRDNLDLGEVVEYLGETATWTYGANELEMLKVSRDDEIGYVWSDLVAVDAVPGVLSSEARIYSEGEEAGVTTRHLPVLQMVAIYNEEFEDDLVKVGFTPLIPDENYRNNAIYTVYVKRIRLTTQTNDVKVAHLYYLSTRTSDEELQITRLEIALETRSTFSDEIRAELDSLTAEEQPMQTGDEGGEVFGPIPADFQVDCDVEGSTAVINTRSNLRDKPSTSANSLGLLEAGTHVLVNARTVDQETIQGLTAHWYAVSVDVGAYENPMDGWVFGALLDFE